MKFFRCHAYLSDGMWTLRNCKGSNTYLGRWDDTDEIAGNTQGDHTGRYDIYAILRGQYVAVAESVDKASETSPLDISYVITNADATRYNKFHAQQPVGWMLSSDDAFEVEYANYLPAKVGDSYFNKWQGSGNLDDRSISQHLTGLPLGKYRLGVKTSASTIHAGAWLFANDKEVDMTQLSGNSCSLAFDITDGELTFGVRLNNYQSNDCKFDHFTLEYLGGSSATGLTSLSPSVPVSPTRIYDLQGRRRSRLEKGINIVNGEKVYKP